MTEEQQQIEEMAKYIAVARGYGCNEQDHCDMSCQACKCGCIPHEDAQILYAENYRRQITGKWIIVEHESFTCSACNYDFRNGCSSMREAKKLLANDLAPNYCPNCGARMKGVDANA